MNQPLRIVFAGTPDIATAHLKALVEADHHIIAVYTQPDRPAGRGKKLTASSVKNYALSQDIPVYQPVNFKEEQTREQLAALAADVMVVVAYGLLLPQAVLDIPKYGCLNVHGSILPRWRGAAPIQRAIWAGDKETGITIMQMNAGLDTGDMLNIATTPIADNETSATLYDKLSALGPQPLLATLHQLQHQQLRPVVQNEAEVTYAEKLSKDEAKIDFSQHASFIGRCIRAFNPWPISYFLHQGQPVKVWQGYCSEMTHDVAQGTVMQVDKTGLYIAAGEQSVLIITHLQLPGKKPLAIQDLLNAKPDIFQEGMLISAE